MLNFQTISASKFLNQILIIFKNIASSTVENFFLTPSYREPQLSHSAITLFFYKKHFSLREMCSYSELSGPYFSTFGLNTERYAASLPIQSECGKIRTRKTPNTDTFYAVFINNARLKLAKKIKRNPRNIWRLNFCYLKYIRYLHLLYHPKIIGDVLKNVQKQVRLFKSGYMINDNENKVEIEKLTT